MCSGPEGPFEEPVKKKAYVETYGCQMNISDGELMQGILEQQGYDIVDRPEAADVVLVNTCAIREHAESRVLGRVAQLNGLKRDRPDLVLGVTGCMAQRMGEGLLERAPYVDLVMGPDGYRSLPEHLDRVEESRQGSGRRSRQLAVLSLDPAENYAGLEQRRTSTVSAWVPIQRGCDHRCTFCIVPYVRGPEKNRDPGEVLDEVRELAATGLTELTMLGQTVNSYEHGAWSFPRLLEAVARVPGIRRVRFTSPHPNDVTPELVEVMAREPAVCEHIHLPAQSGSDRTLKRMLRRYTVEGLVEKVDMLRSRIPDIAISTDIIAGFPGETAEEFEETLRLMRRVRFDEAYTYKYSPRDGTPATRLPAEDFLPAEVAQARLERLIEISRGIVADIARSELGRTEEVLVERAARTAGQVLGRTRRNKVVAFPGDPSMIGRYYVVVLDDTTGVTFRGRRVEEPALTETP
jgi:tRNA-2-methylthio-N6-dimethylallyladenosine synthase